MALLNCFHIFYRYYVCDKMFLSRNFCVHDINIMAPRQPNIYALKFPRGTLDEM